MSLITQDRHNLLVLREDGSYSTANSALECLILNHSDPGFIGDVVASGSSNASINGTYTANGTYYGEVAYEQSGVGWIYYNADGRWCWNETKEPDNGDADYLTNSLLAVYRQRGGPDTFLVESGNGATYSTFLAHTVYISELITDSLQMPCSFFDYDTILNLQGVCGDVALRHNGDPIIVFPTLGDGKALAFPGGLETSATINSLDLDSETEGEDGSWVTNSPVQIKGSAKTPETYTNNVIGVESDNTVSISGWPVTSPSEASRYVTGNTLASPKVAELLVDTDDNNLKLYVQESITDGTVYGNTWMRIGYNFPSFKPIDDDDYRDGYKLALTSLCGDLKDYPLYGLSVTSHTLNASATATTHSGAGWTVNDRIVLSGAEDLADLGGNFAVVDMSDPDSPSYSNLSETSWNTSNGVVGNDGQTIFLVGDEGDCMYTDITPTSNSDITSVDISGFYTSHQWQAITRGPSSSNAVYGVLYKATLNTSVIVKQTTYPTANTTNASNTLNSSTGQLWTSLTLSFDDNIYALPATANGDVLKITTSNDAVSTINIGTCPAVRQTILAPNGMLYGFPDDYTANVVKFDPVLETAELLDAVGTQNETRYQGFCDASGKLVVFPSGNGGEIIVFDPVTEEATILTQPTGTYEDYLTILPGPPGTYYRFDDQGKYMHVIKLYATLDDYDVFWKYTSYNSL